MKTTQKEIANLLGVGQPAISKYKTCKLKLKWAQVKKLKDIGWSDIDIENYFSGDSQPNPDKKE
jgi:predicted transcriptional regulator